MENASKALIIAGAILLAIAIISLGLIVVNNVRSVSDNTNLSEQEIQSFNAKFTAYEGESISGSRVNSLIQQVIATNKATYDEGKTNQIVYVGIPYNSHTLWIGRVAGNSEIRSKETRIEITEISNLDTAVDPASQRLSVDTGNNYKVKITKYKDGLVNCICVTK